MVNSWNEWDPLDIHREGTLRSNFPNLDEAGVTSFPASRSVRNASH